MSDFRVLQTISANLRQLLFNQLSASDELSDMFTSENNISLDSPATLADSSDASTAQLSVYLYQVLPDPYLNNRPPIPAGMGQQVYPPLSLRLFYLITPLSDSSEENLLILGRVMQILAANTIVSGNFLDSRLRPTPPEMRVTLNPVNLEELTRIWSAFNQPYSLSVCYQVQAVSIDSTRPPREEPPITEALFDVHQIVQSGGGAS